MTPRHTTLDPQPERRPRPRWRRRLGAGISIVLATLGLWAAAASAAPLTYISLWSGIDGYYYGAVRQLLLVGSLGLEPLGHVRVLRPQEAPLSLGAHRHGYFQVFPPRRFDPSGIESTLAPPRSRCPPPRSPRSTRPPGPRRSTTTTVRQCR